MATFKYRAFLSYSHQDTVWAKWLHRALEGYRIDKDLIGRETPNGPVPKTLRPIFRDRDDFSAGNSLTQQTLAALEASEFLIVICSPNAAKSPYVNEEIRRFKALGRGARIIPVIIEGEPGDARQECFPPVLRFKLGADGALTGEHEEPIAADARPRGDGKENAKQKVVAGLLGVGLDEIRRRADRARKRRNRLRVGAVGATLLMLVGAVLGWVGALSVSSRLNREEVLNDGYLAADLCERGERQAAVQHVSEARLIAFVSNCVATLSEGFYRLPSGKEVPARQLSVFEKNLAILRKAKSEGKLTLEESDVLEKAELLAAQLGVS